MSPFHAHSGWYFSRLVDGAVAVSGPNGVSVTFDAGTWASIVASVSATGETGESFYAAERFHAGVTEKETKE